MPEKTTSERLAFFSDAVFAVIITILVLDLKPPSQFTFRALAPLWPVAVSYVVSYFFIAIIWANHHHLFRFARTATNQLIWWNFIHLFMISLLPATTSWMAESRLSRVPVFVYCLNFVLVEIAYICFERIAISQSTKTEMSGPLRRVAHIRSYIALSMFIAATVTALWKPLWGFALVCCVLLIYFSPGLPALIHRWERKTSARSHR